MLFINVLGIDYLELFLGRIMSRHLLLPIFNRFLYARKTNLLIYKIIYLIQPNFQAIS